MTDLLAVDWTSIYETLECLSKDGIKGFLDVEVKDTICKSESYALFKAF